MILAQSFKKAVNVTEKSKSKYNFDPYILVVVNLIRVIFYFK